MPIDSSTEIHAADRYFSSQDVAEILGVTRTSVVKWIRQRELSAFRTLGGHRRISATELVRFATEHGMPIPEALRELAIAKVLAVDDEPPFLRALQRAFKLHAANEFSLETAESGLDAMMAIGHLKPDFLLLDICMPGLDGFEILKRVQANPIAQGLVVIAMSAEMSEATSKRCQKLGAAILPREAGGRPGAPQDAAGATNAAPGLVALGGSWPSLP